MFLSIWFYYGRFPGVAILITEGEEKAKQIREAMLSTDVSQYSTAVMQNKSVLMLANEESDALFEIEQDQIPYISYLRAIDLQLPGGIPGTMKFIESRLSLSRSIDRKGRIEFGQAINKQSIILPQYNQGFQIPGFQTQQEQKPSLISKLLSKRKGANNNV